MELLIQTWYFLTSLIPQLPTVQVTAMLAIGLYLSLLGNLYALYRRWYINLKRKELHRRILLGYPLRLKNIDYTDMIIQYETNRSAFNPAGKKVRTHNLYRQDSFR